MSILKDLFEEDAWAELEKNICVKVEEKLHECICCKDLDD